MEKDFRIVIDIDKVICSEKKENERYQDLRPQDDIVKKLKEYKKNGFYIIIYSSRNMNTYNENLGKINANTAKIILDWLEKYDIPFDEIYFGKPWCGFKGFYVDDKTIRPDEFLYLSYEEILKITGTSDC